METKLTASCESIYMCNPKNHKSYPHPLHSWSFTLSIYKCVSGTGNPGDKT